VGSRVLGVRLASIRELPSAVFPVGQDAMVRLGQCSPKPPSLTHLRGENSPATDTLTDSMPRLVKALSGKGFLLEFEEGAGVNPGAALHRLV